MGNTGSEFQGGEFTNASGSAAVRRSLKFKRVPPKLTGSENLNNFVGDSHQTAFLSSELSCPQELSSPPLQLPFEIKHGHARFSKRRSSLTDQHYQPGNAQAATSMVNLAGSRIEAPVLQPASPVIAAPNPPLPLLGVDSVGVPAISSQPLYTVSNLQAAAPIARITEPSLTNAISPSPLNGKLKQTRNPTLEGERSGLEVKIKLKHKSPANSNNYVRQTVDVQTSSPPLFLRFHQTHSPNVAISEDGLTASRMQSFCEGICFIERAVVVGERVVLRLAEISSQWNGTLRIGFTSHDPNTLKGASLPRYACPDLTNRPGFWAKAVDESITTSGSIVSFWFSRHGNIYVSANGVDRGILLSGADASRALWPLLDIYGNTKTVQLLTPTEIASLAPGSVAVPSSASPGSASSNATSPALEPVNARPPVGLIASASASVSASSSLVPQPSVSPLLSTSTQPLQATEAAGPAGATAATSSSAPAGSRKGKQPKSSKSKQKQKKGAGAGAPPTCAPLPLASATTPSTPSASALPGATPTAMSARPSLAGTPTGASVATRLLLNGASTGTSPSNVGGSGGASSASSVTLADAAPLTLFKSVLRQAELEAGQIPFPERPAASCFLQRIHGRHVSISNGGRTASRDISEYCNAYVFFDRPVEIDQLIIIQILGIDASYTGSLTIGFTNKDPSTLAPPAAFRTVPAASATAAAGVASSSSPVCDLPDDVEMLSSRPPPESWVYSKNVCPRAKVGDELGLCVDADGAVRLYRSNAALFGYVRGMPSPPPPLMHVDPASPLWLWLELYGHTVRVALVGAIPNWSTRFPHWVVESNGQRLPQAPGDRFVRASMSGPGLMNLNGTLSRSNPNLTFDPAIDMTRSMSSALAPNPLLAPPPYSLSATPTTGSSSGLRVALPASEHSVPATALSIRPEPTSPSNPISPLPSSFAQPPAYSVSGAVPLRSNVSAQASRRQRPLSSVLLAAAPLQLPATSTNVSVTVQSAAATSASAALTTSSQLSVTSSSTASSASNQPRQQQPATGAPNARKLTVDDLLSFNFEEMLRISAASPTPGTGAQRPSVANQSAHPSSLAVSSSSNPPAIPAQAVTRSAAPPVASASPPSTSSASSTVPQAQPALQLPSSVTAVSSTATVSTASTSTSNSSSHASRSSARVSTGASGGVSSSARLDPRADPFSNAESEAQNRQPSATAVGAAAVPSRGASSQAAPVPSGATAAAGAGAQKKQQPQQPPAPAKREETPQDECIVCMEGSIETVLYPCGHMCMCSRCAADLRRKFLERNRAPLCPICRQTVKDVIRTFRS